MYLPQEKANNTKTYKKKNFIISITILDKETCSGPRCGFTEKMYTSFKELQQGNNIIKYSTKFFQHSYRGYFWLKRAFSYEILLWRMENFRFCVYVELYIGFQRSKDPRGCLKYRYF